MAEPSLLESEPGRLVLRWGKRHSAIPTDADHQQHFPSLDGESMAVTVVGQSGLPAGQTTNVLWPWKAGANNNATWFMGVYHSYFPSVSNIQSSEKDQFQFNSGHRFMMGMQCESPALGNGKWDIWNQLTSHWITTTVPCTILTTPNVWHTIVIITHRDPLTSTACSGQPCMYFDSLQVDGVTSTGFAPQPSGPSSDPDNTGIQDQIDVSSAGGSATEYLDEFSFSEGNEAWSGLIPPTRATDWTQAGISGGIPTTRTQCGATIPAYTGSSATINNALAHTATGYTACGPNTFIQLGSGTFSLTSGGSISFLQLRIHKLCQQLRGMGANQTFINCGTQITNFAGQGSCIGAISSDTTYTQSPGTVINITDSSFTQGQTVLHVSSTATSAIGKLVAIDQAEDGYTGNGVPTGCSVDTGAVFVTDQTYVPTGGCHTPTGGISETANNNNRPLRPQIQISRIVGVGTGTITISPGLLMPNWNTAQSPQAWTFTPIVGDGVQDLTISSPDVNTYGPSGSAIYFFNCDSCFIQGVEANDVGRFTFNYRQTIGLEVVDNYIFSNQSGQCTGCNPDPYPIQGTIGTNTLIQNNVFQNVDGGWIINGSETGSVFAYNFSARGTTGGNFMFPACSWDHTAGSGMLLYEGNECSGVILDQIHGIDPFITFFRNGIPGTDTGCATAVFPWGCSNGTNAISIRWGSRYNNAIGNAVGNRLYHNEYKDLTGGNTGNPPGSVFIVGWGNFSEISGNPYPPADTVAQTSSFFWGNVPNCTTGTNCGVAQFNSAEVPTSDPNYPVALPSSRTLPCSLYLQSTPTCTPSASWWTAGIPYPDIGPDIIGGNVGACFSGSYQGGYATNSAQCNGGTFKTSAQINGGFIYANPAMNCALATLSMPPDGSGAALPFNRSTCYSTTGTPTVSLSATSLTFAAQVKGTTSVAQTVTLTNTGGAPLTINSITVTGSAGNFPETTTCGATVAPGANCSISVKYSPTYAAPQTSIITIATNAAPANYTIALSGLGTCNGMCLYPSGSVPLRQINSYGGPLNSAGQDYADWLNSIIGFTAGQYMTGSTWFVGLGCTGTCTAANGTYFDQANGVSTIAGGACPNVVFDTAHNTLSGFMPMDTIINVNASNGYLNNFILQNTSYGAGTAGNSITAAYIPSQDWADNLDSDCAHTDPSLTRQSSTEYMPSWYVKTGTTYWQNQQTTAATNTDTSDVRGTTASAPPACYVSGATAGTVCVDGTVRWVSTGIHAPPQDFWCDSTYPGNANNPCWSLVINGTGSIDGSGNATITLSKTPSFSAGNRGYVTGTAGTNSGNFICGDPITNPTAALIGTVNASTKQVTYSCPGTPLTTTASTTLTAGVINSAHSLNVNSAPLAVLEGAMPIPYEQPMKVWTQYMWNQIVGHYKNSLGYIRAFGTKGGEMSQDGVSGWPFYITRSTCSPQSNCSTFTAWEKIVYQFEGANGGGTTVACMGNLNSNPSIEGPYMHANNCGADNNAIGANHAYTLQCFGNPGTQPAWCGTATYSGGTPPSGDLFHGGDWARQFATTFATAQPNGQLPVLTLQTTNEGTPGSSPGGCATGTSAPPANTQCSNGTCSGAVGQFTGSMATDNTCSYTVLPGGGPFPPPSGFTGNYPLAKQ